MIFQQTQKEHGSDSYSVAFLDADDQTPDAKIAACRNVFSLYFQQLVEHFLRSIPAEAGAYFSKKGDKGQGGYLEFLQKIQTDKEAIQREYGAAVISAFDQFWSKDTESRFPPEADGMALGGVALMEEEALEEEYAVSAMIRSGEQGVFSELQIIDRQFAEMAGVRTVNASDNPIGPTRLSRLLVEVLDAMGFELRFKLPVYRVFNQLVLAELGVVYRAVIALLDEHENGADGLVPDAKGSLWGPVAKAAPGVSDPAASGKKRLSDWDAFRSLQTALVEWRRRQGVQNEVRAECYEYYEVLSALTSIQRDSFPPSAADPGMLERPWLKMALEAELQASDTGESPRALSHVDEAAVDLVSMMFVTILERGRFPGSLSTAVAMLQVPVAKVAILDKSMFFKEGHPVRLFVDEVISAAAAASFDDCDGRIAEKIHETVSRLMEEFDLYVGTFIELHADLASFMAKRRRRTSLAEARTIQLVQSRDRLAAAKAKTAREIARRIDGQPLPDFILAFVNDVWKDRLILAYLREDKEPGGWSEGLQVLDKLLRSVVPPACAGDKKEILALLPEMVTGLRAGLKVICYDKHLRSKFFKDLAVCHLVILNCDVLKTGGKGRFFFNRMVTGTGESGVDRTVDGAVETVAGAGGTGAPVPVEGWAEGQRVEFPCGDGTSVQGKLAWISSERGVALFVDTQGNKLAEKTRAEFREAVRSREIVLVDHPDVPVLARALADVTRSLNVSADITQAVPA